MDVINTLKLQKSVIFQSPSVAFLNKKFSSKCFNARIENQNIKVYRKINEHRISNMNLAGFTLLKRFNCKKLKDKKTEALHLRFQYYHLSSCITNILKEWKQLYIVAYFITKEFL